MTFNLLLKIWGALALLLCGISFAASLPPSVNCQNGGCWKPALNTRWNYVLSEAPTITPGIAMYDIDLFDTPAAKVAQIHAANQKAICYIDAGSAENWRIDFKSFPKSVLGANMDGWAGERWLDIRNITALAPIMTARLNLCKQKGFDGVEFDNVDGYNNQSGFPLTASNQLAYNIFLANEAHKRGLTVALKNDLDQVPVLVNYFDYAVNEQCFEYGECNALLPFIKQGKPVFNVEYSGNNATLFKQANTLNFNTIKKSLDLNNKVVFSR